MIGQAIKNSDLHMLEEYPFYASDFIWLSNQATI